MNVSIQVENALLRVEYEGVGSPIMFLHAGVADRRMWKPQFDAFSDHYHTIAYDRRGFGETTSPDETFSHKNDLSLILDHLGLEEISLVGCSQGGLIAIDFALTHPQRVSKLVLIAPAISGAPPPTNIPADLDPILEELDQAEENEDFYRVNEIEAHLWLDGPLSEPGRVSGSLRELFLDMNGIALDLPELEKEIAPPPTYDRVSELAMPTLVLWGELDFPHVKERCQYLVESIPNVISAEIPDTAHLPNLEVPDLVNKHLLDFLIT